MNRTLWPLLMVWGVAFFPAKHSTGAEYHFESDIRPLFKIACFHCHGGPGEKEGGLDLRLVRLMIKGGDSGSVIVPGDPEKSLLWQHLESDEMPKGEKKLSPEDKDKVRAWIATGARTARPEPANVEDARFTAEEMNHWAFKPVTETAVPRIEEGNPGNPIDSFISARLAEAGLAMAEEADRRVLIRRVTLDLTGLPPRPDEVDAFVSDDSPNAWGRLIDRLLASPQFGVRWGRHWLDVAGYAESDEAGGDAKRPHAWRYRDYVINAFNANKPIDEFIVEQLAGDELIEGDLDVRNNEQREYLTATGFLRMGPDATRRSNTIEDRNAAVADALQVVSSSMMGLTVGCAQCHDHKYDPIGIDDYYQFRAIFDPAFPLQKWQPPGNRLIDMTTAEVKAAAAVIEDKAKKIEDDLNVRREARAKEIQKEKIAAVREADREAVREAVLTKTKEQTNEQKRLLDLYPMVKPTSHILGLLIEYDSKSYRKFEQEQKD
ncbi:MAG: DUF1549 domain-containing protein, partial [Verrucomicrobiota bacterium]